MRGLIQSNQIRRRRLIIRAAVFSVVVIGALAAVSFAFSTEMLELTTVRVSGNHAVETGAIESVVAEETGERFAGLFTRTNTLLIPREEVTERIRAISPYIAAVSLSTDFPHTLLVHVAERSPAYVWCRATIEEATAVRSCYFVDKEGFIYGIAPIFSTPVYIELVGSLYRKETLSNNHEPIGSSFLHPEMFVNVITIVGHVRDAGLDPHMLVVYDENDAEIIATSGVRIKFSPIIQSDDFLKLFATIIKAKVLDRKPKYIDVRFDNKIFYTPED